MLLSSLGALRGGSLRLASTRSPVLALPIARHRLLSTVIFPRCQRPQPDTRWRNLRWNSSTAAPPASAPIIPTETMPPAPPTAPEAFIPDSNVVADTIASLPPIQHGDFHALGLCHWTPAGLVQYSFELVHVVTGLPWFYTFIVATLVWRVVIFPFAVIGMRASTRMRPYSERLAAAQADIAKARMAGDTVEIQRAALVGQKLRAEAGVSMAGLMAPYDTVAGISGHSGFEWLPDLTQPGPYYILPILIAASGNLMMSMGMRDMDPTRPAVGHVMNAFRVLTIVTIPWLDTFASGLQLSLFVTSATAVLQSAIFRVPAFRTALKIPPWTPMPAPNGEKLPTMMDTYRAYVHPYIPFLGNKQQQPKSLLGTSKVQPYIPPPSSPLRTTTVFAPPPPPPPPAPPAPPAQPSTLEALAQKAQAHASVKSSSLFEAPAASAPAPTPKTSKPSKTSKGGKKAKAKRA
ncbi:hypothetical protein FB451DRAFT_1510420 [Mycena latifolia]|nr:hypothetical protein FB451DRAFT_1510420 [Mycena latifolia]